MAERTALPMSFCFLPSALCILPSLFSCLLHPAVCRLWPGRQSLLQNLFFGFFDWHAVTPAALIDWPVREHVVPMSAQYVDFVEGVFRLCGAGRCFFPGRGLLLNISSETGCALKTRFGRQSIIFGQRHRRGRRLG